jgi:hypothetical protein
MQDLHSERGEPCEPCRSSESFRKETRMKTLAWAGFVYLPFLDLFWWLR